MNKDEWVQSGPTQGKASGFLACINPTPWCESQGGRAQAQCKRSKFIPLPLKCTISILICEHIPECKDAMLSRFSRVRLCVTPQTVAYQAPPSLGFSRQEHWSGLPFPSPMHESEKSKWSRSVVSDSQRPHELQPTRLLRPCDFPGKSTGVGCHCLHHIWCMAQRKMTHGYPGQPQHLCLVSEDLEYAQPKFVKPI